MKISAATTQTNFKNNTNTKNQVEKYNENTLSYVLTYVPKTIKTGSNRNFYDGFSMYSLFLMLFPHNIDKLIDGIDINFNDLPIKDRAKNIAKFAIPFFGYPLLAMVGVTLAVDTAKNLYSKFSNKETNTTNN